MTAQHRRLLLAVAGPSVVVVSVLLGLWLAVPQGAPSRSSFPGPSHAYSPLEPVWSQTAFPMLGAPTTALLSVSSAGAQMSSLAPPSRRAAALAMFSLVCYGTAVLLFAWLTWEFRCQPLSVGGAALAFALAPAMWASALTWSPYAALLPLLLGAALLTVRGVKTGRLRVWATGVLLALAAAESLAVLPLVAAWPCVVRVSASRHGQRAPRTAWAAASLALVTGAILQLLSTALVYRALATGDGDSSPAAWGTVFGAVTSGWKRLFFTYLPNVPVADTLALAREWAGGTGLLGFVLAVAGVSHVRDTWGRGHWMGLGLVALLCASAIAAGAPVSDAQPLALVLVAVAWLYATAGLEWSRAKGGSLLAVVIVVVALGALGRISRVVEASSVSGRGFDEALDSLLQGIPTPAATVAYQAEIDQRVLAAIARSADGSGWIRVSQQSPSIRQALTGERQVFAFEGAVARLEASGWVLGSPRVATVAVPARRAVRLWRVEAQAPCVVVGGATWTDISTLVGFAALGVQSAVPPPAKLDLRYWASSHSTVEAMDVLSGRQVPVGRLDEDAGSARSAPATGSGPARAGTVGHEGVEGGTRLRLGQRGGSLVVLRFSHPPARAEARIGDGRPGYTIRVCAAPTEGEFVSPGRTDALRELRIDSVKLFGHGWHTPESLPGEERFARWSSSTSSTLRLLLETPREALRFEVEANPARSDRGLTLGLSVNGHALATQEMANRPATYAWVIDPAHLRAGLNIFEFSGPRTVSPREAAGLPDDRQLGFGLTAVRVGRVPGGR